MRENIQIDGPQGQDSLRRSPLHWACATGKTRLAELLLTRVNRPRANVDAVEIRQKTSLHIATAHRREETVEIVTVDGRPSTSRVTMAGAEINSKLVNEMTPLHCCPMGSYGSG